MEIHTSRVTSPLGALHLLCSKQALIGLAFDENREQTLVDLRRHAPHVRLVAGVAPAFVTKPLADYFKGKPLALTKIPAQPFGTSFQGGGYMSTIFSIVSVRLF